MNPISSLKKNKVIARILPKAVRVYCSALTLISPTLNTRVCYKRRFGRAINLDHPQTLCEKILWLKLNRYMKDPLVIQCADKYAVREFVRQRGCGDTLNELYDVYDSVKYIPWEELPDSFVLKWNFGSRFNIICKDKSKLDREETIRKMQKWGKNKYWLKYSEMQYKYIPKKIVCEKYLESPESNAIPDYKIYCFHGVPKAIQLMHDRGSTTKMEFFDADWNPSKGPKKYPLPEKRTGRPGFLPELLDVARKLSEGFPFVRCDLYVLDQKIIFGEMTFTPAAGFLHQTKLHDKDMSEFLCLDDSK